MHERRLFCTSKKRVSDLDRSLEWCNYEMDESSKNALNVGIVQSLRNCKLSP